MPGERRVPDTAESAFRFERRPSRFPSRDLWHVTCEGVTWAGLELLRPEREWRLRGLGPLQGMSAAWEHDGSAVRRVPAGIRRDAVAALATVGLARLKSSHDALARIRESLGAARAVAREEETETGRAA